MPYFVESRPNGFKLGLDLVFGFNILFCLGGFAFNFLALFEQFVVGSEQLLYAGGEFVDLSFELFHSAVVFNLFNRGLNLAEFGLYTVFAFNVFFRLGSFVFNLFKLLLVGGEKFLYAGGEFVYLAVDFANLFRRSGNCRRLFALGGLVNRLFCGLFGCFFRGFFNGLCRNHFRNGLLLFVEGGAHIFEFLAHCGELVVHTFEHSVGRRGNLPRDGVGYLLQALFVDYYVVIVLFFGLRTLFRGGGNGLFGAARHNLRLAEPVAYAVYYRVVIDLGCGYRSEHGGGNLIGNVVCVDFGQVVGYRGGSPVGNGLFVHAVCREFFGYELGNLFAAHTLCIFALHCRVGNGNFACGRPFGNLFYYAVVIEAVYNRFCKRAAAFVVYYYIEIVGRKCADLARNLVGERV